MVAERRCSAASLIDALVLLVVEEIVKAVGSMSQERIRQHITEADQGQSTFECQPKDSRADTSWTGASEQPAFESILTSSKSDFGG